jgi:heptosyltransferase-2
MAMWYPIEKRIKTGVLRWLERRMPGRVWAPSEVDWSGIRHILVVRQHDQFGDFLLTTPAIRALRDRFPEARLTLVVRNYLLPVALHNPDVDEVALFHESAWRWTPRAARRFIRQWRQPYDLAVVFNTVSHSLSSDLIAYGSGAPRVLGPAAPPFDGCARNPFYTLVAPVSSRPTHQIHRNLDVVRHIGADTEDLAYRFALTPQEEATGRALAAALAASPPERRVGVHFGTKDARKRYPIPKLAALCRRLHQQEDMRLILIPAPGETAALNALKTLAGIPLAVAPALPLRQVAALLKALDLFICNDTGVLHLAAAVGTPTVSFHAISDPAFWKPVGPQFIALYAKNGRIDAIPVDLALQAAACAIRRRNTLPEEAEPAIYAV